MAPANQKLLLEVQNLSCAYRLESSALGARRLREVVSGVSLKIHVGETLGVVGESGSGKTTMVRGIMQVPRPVKGRVVLHGRDLVELRGRDLRRARRRIGFVFQDPFSSLNPVWSVERLVGEPIVVDGKVARADVAAKVTELLEVVGLDPRRDARRRIGEFSGGQSQRVAIARALASSPDLLICDEPVSALDVSIQAQVLKLFEQLKADRGLSYLFISHDLNVVEYISDRVAVLFLGKMCEIALTSDLYSNALHPYTQALIAASPRRGQRAIVKERSKESGISALEDVTKGCRYSARCPMAEQRCRQESPELRLVGPSHWVACHLVKR